MQEIVYLNNEFTSKNKARISPFDRGFLFGDAIYEGVPIYNQRAFLLNDHYLRLTNNLKKIGIEQPLSLKKFTTIITTLATQPKTPTHYGVYFQISRGCNYQRNHSYQQQLDPTIFACLQPIQEVTFAKYNLGFTANINQDLRWHQPHIKSTSLLANILHLQTAMANNNNETLLYDNNNNFTEGCSSNVFFVKDNLILTPTTDAKILPGITRNKVISLAIQSHFKLQEVDCHIDLIKTCDEVFITGAYKELMPIIKVGSSLIGNGKPGKIWAKLFNAYQQCITQNLTDLSKCQQPIL